MVLAAFDAHHDGVSGIEFMLKVLCVMIQVIIGFYWAGDMARQNPRIDSLVDHLERGYGSFNEKLKDAKIIDGLSALRAVYGWAAIGILISLVVTPKFLELSAAVFSWLSAACIGSAFGWFSINWCVNHSNTVRAFRGQGSIIIFGPILMGVFDQVFNTPFTQILAESSSQILMTLGWEIPQSTHSIVVGSVMSLILATFFGVYYLLAWLLTVPAAFVSAGLILLPVLFAKIVHAIAPKKPFAGFTFVIFAGASLGTLSL